MTLAECVKGEEDAVPELDALLTAADGRELEIEQDAPELGGGLGVGRDTRDEEVIELGVERSAQLCEYVTEPELQNRYTHPSNVKSAL